MPEGAGPLGTWGEHTFRSYLVGGPALLAAQEFTGGSRPQEREQASHWRPFNDNNGVSGHAFIGAVPFLTMAHLSASPALRDLAYAASGPAAWSRINDDAHFPSQAFLGWYLAYEFTEAVAATDTERPAKPTLAVLPWSGGGLVEMDYRW